MTKKNEPIISVNNVSKVYSRTKYRPSLRHEAKQFAKRILRRGTPVTWRGDEFWALRDLDFDVHTSEALAILGRNGAGKTTLLRLLSNVTSPTTGHITINGRFASLIGLGAGFNPERTGRQNIYLNCAIFGMEPVEVTEMIEEIIAFSEIEAFIDQPVKLYSSGMVARLGFSIAVHILPDIIFLDEILSVGDAAFQAKCEQRIFQLREQNCTIVFVSHQIHSVLKLCDRGIVLHYGELMFDGDVTNAVALYLSLATQTPETEAAISEMAGRRSASAPELF